MKLYIRQRLFSLKDRFSVLDEWGNDRYYVEGELFSWGKKLHILNRLEKEVASIHQQLFTLLPRYTVYLENRQVAEIVKELTLFYPRYSIEGLGWQIEGSFLAHDYQIYKADRTIVTIRKSWMSWGDSYELDIVDPADELLALAVVLTIDCVTESANNHQ